MIFYICVFLVIATNLLSMKIENKYQFNDTLISSAFSKNRDSLFIESSEFIYYVNLSKNEIESKENTSNLDSIISLYNQEIIGYTRVFTKDRKYIIVSS